MFNVKIFMSGMPLPKANESREGVIVNYRRFTLKNKTPGSWNLCVREDEPFNSYIFHVNNKKTLLFCKLDILAGPRKLREFKMFDCYYQDIAIHFLITRQGKFDANLVLDHEEKKVYLTVSVFENRLSKKGTFELYCETLRDTVYLKECSDARNESASTS